MNLFTLWKTAKTTELIWHALLMLHKDVKHMTAILDDIAKDWPALRDAITVKLGEDADTIEKLTKELADTAVDDPRAAQIDGEIKDLLAKIKGVVANTPAPVANASAAPSPSAPSDNPSVQAPGI